MALVNFKTIWILLILLIVIILLSSITVCPTILNVKYNENFNMPNQTNQESYQGLEKVIKDKKNYVHTQHMYLTRQAKEIEYLEDNIKQIEKLLESIHK